ncbi:MAG: hypothetical protein E3J26_03510 [Candidatus Zixiibacteriota bacterium]|nr:MAG: hypothetical protein E3J26_03510 [candidate division Zixibacteria bacterium]
MHRLVSIIDRLEVEKAELLEACQLAAIVLAEHEQYDGDEPSRESEAAEACRNALTKAEPPTK